METRPPLPSWSCQASYRTRGWTSRASPSPSRCSRGREKGSSAAWKRRKRPEASSSDEGLRPARVVPPAPLLLVCDPENTPAMRGKEEAGSEAAEGRKEEKQQPKMPPLQLQPERPTTQSVCSSTSKGWSLNQVRYWRAVGRRDENGRRRREGEESAAIPRIARARRSPPPCSPPAANLQVAASGGRETFARPHLVALISTLALLSLC